ncbi:MAG: bifunctional DNA primase/polymerase, partial [Dehalococcoidia bacterium]|nr:bifunctional DNA primase/polymerase [Dehalococcoidia bacterium]
MNDQSLTPSTVLEEARRLSALGIAVTKVRARDKRPTTKGWQNAPAPDDPQLVTWFGDGQSNIGIRTGPISGNFVDLDNDNEKFARYLAAVSPDWLLAAPRYRRGDRPHILLPIEPLPDYAKYTLGKMTIVEVRGD